VPPRVAERRAELGEATLPNETGGILVGWIDDGMWVEDVTVFELSGCVDAAVQ